jgi:hypothetical protein
VSPWHEHHCPYKRLESRRANGDTFNSTNFTSVSPLLRLIDPYSIAENQLEGRNDDKVNEGSGIKKSGVLLFQEANLANQGDETTK